VSGTTPGDSTTRTDREAIEEWLVGFTRDALFGPSPRYREVADALRAAITSGGLPVGTRLPPQRELARMLSVGRTTVVSACNLLRADSLLTTRQGAGTWVANPVRRRGNSRQ
jgi:DNA-binding GntR family transcriptional regulator